MPVSQRTLVRMMEVLASIGELEESKASKKALDLVRGFRHGSGVDQFYSRTLYEYDFPDWFLTQASEQYGWNWDRILIDLRNLKFLRDGGGELLPEVAKEVDESNQEVDEVLSVTRNWFSETLAAIAVKLSSAAELDTLTRVRLLRSIEL